MATNSWNDQVIERFRAGEEIVGLDRNGLILLTTTGRRSGEPRTSPMVYYRDGDRLLVFASFNGAPKHPDWYLNLDADPHVTVEIGAEKYDALATTISDEERDRLWAAIVAAFPALEDHQAKVERVIPVVALTRV